MEQSKQRTYKLISVGKTLYLSWCWKLWGFDFMLSCFHQNFWKLERGQLLQFAKCVNCRYFLWSLRNENLRQCLNDGNISFVIKPKPTEHFSLNWSIYYFFFFFLAEAEGFTQVLSTVFSIINFYWNSQLKIFLFSLAAFAVLVFFPIIIAWGSSNMMVPWKWNAQDVDFEDVALR